MLEPVENLAESAENEEESVSDAEEQGIIFASIKQISNLIVGCCFCDGLNCLCASFSLLVPWPISKKELVMHGELFC